LINFEKIEELLKDLGRKPDLIAKTKFISFFYGYNFVQHNSSTIVGGVGLFIKNTLNFKIV